ncbi:hypothetical protein [Cytobacillus horneckiae]
MLDQNSDRMYWVVGTVVIVGGMILLANDMFPELFNEVIGKFKNTLSMG